MIIEHVEWNEEKDKWLQETRGISFRRIADLILQDDVLDVIDNPNQERYAGQRLLIVKIDDYAYVVPFVEEGGRAFLKTIIPSRKATRAYLRKK
jgi:hypothetical protein